MQEAIKKIIRASVNAPSGENVQPWRFVIKGDKVKLYNLSERDKSFYNWKQKGSYLAHGALITNMKVSAQHYGYTLYADLFPEDETDLVAILSFTEGSNGKDKHLFSCIEKRSTNRKSFSKEKLNKSIREDILKSAASIKGVEVVITDNDDEIKKCAQFCSTNEEVMLQTKELHSFFFSHINWTKEEDEKKKIGFYIKTLELPKPVEGLFKIIKHWKALKILNKIGFAENVARQNAIVYSSAAVFGGITVENLSNESFLRAGEALEMIWLTSIKHNLYLHPFGGTSFLYLKIKAEDNSLLSEKAMNLIEKKYDEINGIFKLNSKKLAILFRIGSAELPSARAARFEPEILINKSV